MSQITFVTLSLSLEVSNMRNSSETVQIVLISVRTVQEYLSHNTWVQDYALIEKARLDFKFFFTRKKMTIILAASLLTLLDTQRWCGFTSYLVRTESCSAPTHFSCEIS